jgi:hypothetical protein
MPRKSAASLHFPDIVRTERLSPPADLNASEREVFLNVVATTAADHFRPSDLPLLSAYARAVVREREASEHLATQGVVSIDNKLSAWAAVQASGAQADAVACPPVEAHAARAPVKSVTPRQAAAAELLREDAIGIRQWGRRRYR